jgi:TatD DNase family protein
MSKYIDIGANLTNKKFKNIDQILQNATECNVERIIITGTNMMKSIAAVKMVEKYGKFALYATVGVHPHDASSCDTKTISKMEKLIKSNDYVCAVGECGLDYNRMFSPKNVQLRWFEEQIKLAIKLEKPLFLHERDAANDFYNMLVKYKGKVRGVVHCFTGNKETVQKYVGLGMHIGITGWICDLKRNKDLLEAVKCVPLDKLMIETDAPFLSPVKNRLNEPSNVGYVVNKMAQVLHIDETKLAKILYDNTVKFFEFE